MKKNRSEIDRLRFQQTEEIKDLIDLGRDLKFVVALTTVYKKKVFSYANTNSLLFGGTGYIERLIQIKIYPKNETAKI